MKRRRLFAAGLACSTLLSMATGAMAATFDENGISGPGELPISEEMTELSVFIVQLSSVAELTEHSVILELEEATNVKLNMTLVPQDGAKEKLNLTLAGGEYPDIIVGDQILSNEDLAKYGIDEEILIPLNDLIDTYGVNIKERWEDHPNWKEEMTLEDGNIYGIPRVDAGGEGHTDCSYKLWINTDWLEAVGMEMPTTTEEFKAVLEAFRDKDPNGNGIADEIPLTGATNTWAADPYLFLLNAFGYYNGKYYLKDDVIYPILDQDYLKDGLAYVHELYEEGLIDPAAFTQDEAQMSAIGNNADGIIAGAATCGHVGMFVNINDAERYGQYEIMMPLTGPNGYQGIPYTTSSSVSGATFAITDVCENPEVAIKLADLFCGEEWCIRSLVGIEGNDWEYAEEGSLGMDGVTPAKYSYLQFSTQTSVAQDDVTWDRTMRLLEPNWKNLFSVDGDLMDPVNYEARLYADTVKLKEYAADVDMMPPLTYTGDDSSTYSQLDTAVGDFANNAIVEFITGKRDIEKDWDAYLEDLDMVGYYDLIDLVQTTYDAQK